MYHFGLFWLFSLDLFWFELLKMTRKSSKSETAHALDRKRTLFIVDDNNYYRSMRQEYHRLARDAGAGFCQLHVSMTVEQALR